MVNLLVILLAARLTGISLRWRRFLPAAAAGGVYACVALASDAAASLPVKAAVALAMCFIGFRTRGEKHFWLGACAFFATSFVLAGAAYACMVGFGEPALIGGAIVVRPPVRYILTGLCAGTALTIALARVRRRVQRRESGCVRMCLRLEGRQTKVSAFVDTGNLVREPLSGCGVIFLSRAAAHELLGAKLLALVRGQAAPATDRLRIVPCATAAGPNVFYGIKIDGASLCGAKKSVGAVVCVARRALSGYGAIVGGGMVDELKKGAENEDAFLGTKTGGMGDSKAEAGGGSRLHQRKRGASPALDAPGGGDAAASAGGGRQVGPAGPH